MSKPPRGAMSKRYLDASAVAKFADEAQARFAGVQKASGGAMSERKNPGKEAFASEKEAQDFACERVREMWITHYYPDAPGVWIVQWWCQ